MSFVNLSWKFAFTDDFAHRHKIVYHHCWFPCPVYQDDHRCHDLQFRPEDLSGPESHTGGHSPARKAAHALHSPTMQGKAH